MTSDFYNVPSRSSTSRRTRCLLVTALLVAVLIAAVASGHATALLDNPGILAALIAAGTLTSTRDRRRCRRR